MYFTIGALIALRVACAGVLAVGVERAETVHAGDCLTRERLGLIAQEPREARLARALISQRALLDTPAVVLAAYAAARIKDGLTIFAQRPIGTIALVICTINRLDKCMLVMFSLQVR